MNIADNYRKLREEIPHDVTIVLAGKTKTAEEIAEVINAGATDIGQNYVQEGEAIFKALGSAAEHVTWHMIGHLQTNKINKALRVFDVIQTVDSLQKAIAIDKRVETAGKSVVPVCIEINIGSEESKTGIKPEEHEPFEDFMERLVVDMSKLPYLKIAGLMTMGPRSGNPESSRPYFTRTKRVFERIQALELPSIDMQYLSMGMTNSYRIAIEEGANMVRIGTTVFGERGCRLTTR